MKDICSDKSIVELLFGRDETVLSLIEQEYGKLIRAVAFNITGSEEDAKDCLNEVLLNIWNTIPPNSPVSMVSYSCMLARRRAIDTLRSRNKNYITSFDEAENVLFFGEFDAELADREAIMETLERFLKKLGRKNREIFLSRYYDFEEIKTISQEYGCSERSVISRLSRMRNKLKRELKQAGFDL